MDQFVQLAVVGFDHIVQILHLWMHCLFSTSALGLQGCNRDTVSRRFVLASDLWLLLRPQPIERLPRNRSAALASRDGRR